ncbi:hypothetical protein AB0I27_38165 [Streptomyces sp. NPDC050597]|uniref:hypothetical protein n=1 Tax=Streptomyces sp. NPDC050597 TaxID=3157212 RepID=UPI0034142575
MTSVRRDGSGLFTPPSADTGGPAVAEPGLCPVCWSSAEPGRCGTCGWEPDATAGPEARDEELAACWSWDIAAAVLASRHLATSGRTRSRPSGGAVDVRLRSLARRAPSRGPAPSAQVPDPKEDRDVPRGSLAGAVSVLTSLAAGECDAVCVLGISATGLTVRELGRDEHGTGWAHGPGGGGSSWPEAAPWLPASAAERAFVLAGGIGTAPPYGVRGVPRATDQAWQPVIDRALHTALAALRAARTQGRLVPLVLVCQAVGWRWPDHAAKALAARTPAAARVLLDASDVRGLDDIVAKACHQVPLRHGYALLTRPTQAGPPDQERTSARIFFPGGTALPQEGELLSSVDLLADPGQTSGVYALPLVTTRGARTEDWPVLRTGRTRVRPGGRTTVTVALDRDGQLRFAGPELLAEDRWRTLPQPTDPSLPRSGDADLLLLFELGGDRREFERRARFLRTLLQQIDVALRPGRAEESPVAARGPSVGLIGYEDHTFMPVRAESALTVLRHWGPGSARAAAEAVRRFPARPVRHDYAAPLEDALHAAARWPHWRDDARHVLIVLARRPPHPARQQADLSLPCPDGRDYEASLRRLRSVSCPGLTVVGVRDPASDSTGQWRPKTLERLQEAWRDLGRDHLFTLGTHTPEDVALCVSSALGHPAEAPGLLTDPGGPRPAVPLGFGPSAAPAQPEGQ